ncbi:hypothetical protein ACWPKO_18280 [Coraliomargarita sp. W4R53]
MQFSATFRHIDQDFGFEGLELGHWSAEYDDEEAFILALNRMAIASSQHSLLDFPEVDVQAEIGRITVRAINGQLFYTDLHSKNRKDLKVVPVEVVRLIGGKPLEEVFLAEETSEDECVPPAKSGQYKSGSSLFTKGMAFVLMVVVLSFSGKYIWQDVSHTPRLHTAPQFIPSLSEQSDVLRQYADVYVSEYREGAMLFELTRRGEFARYEMWHSTERNGFVLVHIDTQHVQVGRHDGQTAMLANEIYLLVPQQDESMELHGVHYSRHHGPLVSIGELIDLQR